MPASYDYAVLRVVPRVERQEFVNVGVIVFCKELRYLRAKVEMNEARLLALWAALDIAEIRQHTDATAHLFWRCFSRAYRHPLSE